MSKRAFLTANEILYRELVDNDQIEPDETGFRIRWFHSLSGTAGFRRYAVLSRDSTDMWRLINYWNGSSNFWKYTLEESWQL